MVVGSTNYKVVPIARVNTPPRSVPVFSGCLLYTSKLKKSVRGLVVVHPMTALGREMGLQEMTGFSKTAF